MSTNKMHVKIIVYIFIILTIFEQSSAFSLHSKISDLVQKAKDLYKKKYHKDKTWHFLGYDKTEYPGTDKNLLDLNKDKWNIYYDCLQKQEENLKSHGSIIPEAALGFEGQLITFECKVCLSPSEVDNIDAVDWFFGPEDSEKLLPMDISEHILVSPEDKTLHLYNLGLEQTGQYVCQLNGQLTAPYFLTVMSDKEPLREVLNAGLTNGPEIPWILGTEGLLLDTFWSDWSPCSKCKTVGKRHKPGYCILGLTQNLSNDTISANNKNKKESNESLDNMLKIKLNFTISNEELEILRVFIFGIPCRSHILPHLFKNIPQIRDRPSEIATGLCKVACPKGKVFVVKDNEGNILESANNSAGIYSMLQGIPKAKPDIERTLQYEETDTTITLTCPGNLNTDTPIQWQIGMKRVKPSVITVETHGRVYVTIMEKIVIKRARVSDSDVYSCWQNKELAGAIRVIVEKSFKLNFNHHFMLFGVAVIMLTITYVFVRAFMGRKNVEL